MRETILRQMKRHGLNPYKVAKASGLPMRGVYSYLAGDCDMVGERLAKVLDAVGLEIRAKEPKQKKSQGSTKEK